MTRRLIQLPAGPPRPVTRAFTLMELLVVLAIIGILAAIALPSINGMRKSSVMTSATQQLVADIATARHTAIRQRTTVHMIFVPPDINMMGYNTSDPRDSNTWVNLQTHPYTAYAFFAERTVGDQPGQPHPRYLGPWHTLPDGVIIALDEFMPTGGAVWDNAVPENRPFQTNTFPFPTVNGPLQLAPHISFDAKGALIVQDSGRVRVYQDEVIYLARASVLVQRDPANRQVLEFDVRENPPGNGRFTNDNYNRIRIDGLTGRTKVERPELQ